MAPSLIETAVTNLTSPMVLAFALGVVAVLLRSTLRIPDALSQALSMFLLLAIGLKGGVALRGSDLGELGGAVAAALGLGFVLPVLAFLGLRLLTRLDTVNRGAVAAHYGSTSLVTFTAALLFLQSSGIEVPGTAATMLAILEVPGIVVAIYLAQRGQSTHSSSWAALHEILVSKSIVLLLGGLVIGWLTGPAGYEPIAPFFSTLFPGVLTIFLLSLGLDVGSRLGSIRHAGPGLAVFAVVFPLLAGALGVGVGALIGLGVGGAAILGVLCASASYIAAPAAVRMSLPEANLSIALTASLGMTFPFNLILGIPLLTWLAERLAG